jgi:hypothetical protein
MGDAHDPDRAGGFDPRDIVPPSGWPDTVDGWKAVTDRLLDERCCVFHRNAAISTHYARIYEREPTLYKWAAMAAIASHHVRLALLPFRIHTDRTGYVDIPTSLRHGRRLLAADVDTIRSTNNAIFDDIFWVHVAYATADHGIEQLRSLLRTEPHYAPVLAGFEALDEARRVLDQETASQRARQVANELIWTGNVALLLHEQRAIVQPNFDRLSSSFGRILSIGSATTFEVRGVHQELAHFTSFYLYSLSRGFPNAVRARSFPRITRFDDRWRWLEMSVVPRFRLFDANAPLVDASMRRIFDVSRYYASLPCLAPSSEGHRHGA